MFFPNFVAFSQYLTFNLKLDFCKLELQYLLIHENWAKSLGLSCSIKILDM